MEEPKEDPRNPNLPSEVCIEILAYLPAKSLLRFRSVSKEWRSIIDHRDFASLHLRQCSNNNLKSPLIVVEIHSTNFRARRFNGCVNSTVTGDEYNPEVPRPPYPEVPRPRDFVRRSHTIVGDANGLILLSHGFAQVQVDGGVLIKPASCLWNPSIRKSFQIPLPPGTTLWIVNTHLVFDPSTNDYKVVNFGMNDDERLQSVLAFDIFSLNSYSWRTGGSCSTAGGRSRLGLSTIIKRGVSLGGCIHWIHSPTLAEAEIFSFNVCSETCSYTPLPQPSDDSFDTKCAKLVVVDELLGLLANDKTSDAVHIWVLGRDASWSKRYSIDMSSDKFIQYWVPNYFTRDGTFIWRSNMNRAIVIYDTKTGKKRVDETGGWMPDHIGAYIENLVLLTS